MLNPSTVDDLVHLTQFSPFALKLCLREGEFS